MLLFIIVSEGPLLRDPDAIHEEFHTTERQLRLALVQNSKYHFLVYGEVCVVPLRFKVSFVVVFS